MDGQDGEQDALAGRIALVRDRIIAACDRAGRDPSSVQLVAVTKGQPVPILRGALRAGLLDLGENRVQELVEKAALLSGDPDLPAPAWHLIGHLQRNKVRDALPHLAALHSIDSARLVEEIARRSDAARGGAEHPLPCYLEVNVAGEDQKTGVAIEGLPALLAAATACPALCVEGLMTVAPRVDDPEAVRPVFRTLRQLAEAHGLPGLSMGMTDDFDVAVEEGATAIRVGRAIFPAG